jgi:hypothetical protein
MSRASAAVLFPDGTIKCGMYCGTTDMLWPRLFDTLDEAWETYERTCRDTKQWLSAFYPREPLEVNSGEPVRIFENYGGGYEWGGFATREFVTSELDLMEIEDVTNYDFDSEPAWVVWK